MLKDYIKSIFKNSELIGWKNQHSFLIPAKAEAGKKPSMKSSMAGLAWSFTLYNRSQWKIYQDISFYINCISCRCLLFKQNLAKHMAMLFAVNFLPKWGDAFYSGKNNLAFRKVHLTVNRYVVIITCTTLPMLVKHNIQGKYKSHGKYPYIQKPVRLIVWCYI